MTMSHVQAGGGYVCVLFGVVFVCVAPLVVLLASFDVLSVRVNPFDAHERRCWLGSGRVQVHAPSDRLRSDDDTNTRHGRGEHSQRTADEVPCACV